MRAFLIGLFFLMFVAVAPEVFMALLNYIIVLIIVLIIILSIYLYIDHKLYLERKRKRKELRRGIFKAIKERRKKKK